MRERNTPEQSRARAETRPPLISAASRRRAGGAPASAERNRQYVLGLGLLAASGAVGFSKQNWVVDEGATLAQTLLRNSAAAMAVPAGVLAANAPDVDAVTMFVSRDMSLGFRRGWTHGVLAMAVLPLVLTVPARARPGGGAVGAGRRHGRGHCCRLTSARVLGHPLLDWLNTHGVPLGR